MERGQVAGEPFPEIGERATQGFDARVPEKEALNVVIGDDRGHPGLVPVLLCVAVS
jgi:hypothetical protein